MKNKEQIYFLKKYIQLLYILGSMILII